MSLTPAHLASLKAELDTDPKALGYAPYLVVGNYSEIELLLNATSGPGAETVTLQSLGHDDFANLIAPAVMALGASATLQEKWMPMLNLISGTQRVLLSTRNLGMLNALVTDGLMSGGDITAGTTRIGSRAEVLFGAGEIIEWQDVARADGKL